MSDRFSTDQKILIDRDNRVMEDGGIPMSGVLEEVFQQLDAGNVGIEALAKDVDAIAKDGGSFSWDESNSKGLVFAYTAGRFCNGAAIVEVAGSTLTLTNNASNYVEVSSAGVVSSTTGGFTSGRMPLFLVVTASGVIATVTQRKPVLSMVMPDTIAGAKLTAAAKTKALLLPLATISASGSSKIIVPQSQAATLAAVRITVDTTVSQSDTDYWQFSLVNKGAGGSGTTDMLAIADSNSTKTTGGAVITANVPRALVLHGTAANLETAGAHVLVFTATKTGSAANLVNPVLQFEFTNQA